MRDALVAGLGACAIGNAASGPWRADAQSTPGWGWMTPPERVEFQRRIRGFDSRADCEAYVAGHRERLRLRAGHAASGPASAASATGEGARSATADPCAHLPDRRGAR